jgi:hypothetical protein
MYTGPNIITDGLVLYLDAANPKSYPGTGTVWSDLSGNGNNGTLTNGPTFNPRDIQSEISFDGTNDLVNFNNRTAFDIGINHDFTFEYLIKFNPSKTQHDLFGFPGYNPRWGYAHRVIGVNNNTQLRNELWYNLENGGWEYTRSLDSTYFNFSEWVFCSVSKSSSTTVFTLNNRQSIHTGRPNSGYTNTLNVIRLNSVGWGYGAYSIGYFKVYNRGLSIEEIQQNYNATKSRFNL